MPPTIATLRGPTRSTKPPQNVIPIENITSATAIGSIAVNWSAP